MMEKGEGALSFVFLLFHIYSVYLPLCSDLSSSSVIDEKIVIINKAGLYLQVPIMCTQAHTEFI